MAVASELERARAAFDAREWNAAAAGYSRADEAGGAADALNGDDLERWGLAAFLIGRDGESDEARERAHYAFLADGEPEGAVRVGHMLGIALTVRGEVARAQGWFGRLETVLHQHELTDSVWSCYLAVSQGMGMLFGGQPAAAVEHFTTLLGEAQSFDDAQLHMLIRNGLGQSLVACGRVSEGLRRLDEVMVCVTTDRAISPQLVGLMYCAVIDACRICFDVRRAQEWTEALNRWCAEQPGLVPYRGQCLVHRSEVLQIHGSWRDASTEIERVVEFLNDHPRDAAAGMAHYQRGELHRLRGEFTAAAASYQRAAELGRDPQPGLALLRLAQGDAAAALRVIARVVEEQQVHAAELVRLLPAFVEISLAAGDVDQAAAAAAQLAAAAERQESPYLSAAAAFADGQVAATTSHSGHALVRLREALVGWLAIGATYDAARCRVGLALVCRAAGDEETAQLELIAAAAVFAELGAEPDGAMVEQLRQVPDGPARPNGLTAREIEVLRLLATGATNRVIASELFLSEKTVARHVANIFLKLGVSSRSAATAYAFEHRLAGVSSDRRRP